MRALQAQWVGYDANSTHAYRVYWPGKNSITVEHDVKFVLPTIVINTLPPSYAPTMAPVQTLPAPPQAAPAPPAQPLTVQAPPAPPLAASAFPVAPPSVFILAPPPAAPPTTPVIQMHQIGDEDKDKVEQTITLHRITILTMPVATPSEPHCSGCTSHAPGYYRQLTQEDDDAEHLDFAFSTQFSDIIAAAISDLSKDLTTLHEA